MVLNFFKNNQAYHFFSVPLFVFLLWAKSFISPILFEGADQMPLYHMMEGIIFKIPLINNLITIALLLFSTFLILYINSAYDFISVRSFLPSNIYVFIVCGFVPLQTLHPAYFGAVFLLLALDRLFTAFTENFDYPNAFNAGFFIGVGTLFYAPLLFFFPVFLVGFIIWSTNREWRFPILSVIGVSLPLFFTFSYYYFLSDTSLFWEVIILNITNSSGFEFSLPLKIYAGFWVTIILIGSTFLIVNFGRKTINERKFFRIFFLIFLFSILILIWVPAVSVDIFIIQAIPAAFLFSNYLVDMKSRIWGDIFMIAIIGFTIYMLFV